MLSKSRKAFKLGYLSLILFSIISCSENQKKHKDQIESQTEIIHDSANEDVKEIASNELANKGVALNIDTIKVTKKESLHELAFYSAIPNESDHKVFEFLPHNIEIDWSSFVPNNDKPRSSENTAGIVVEDIDYSDWGLAEYSTKVPFRFTIDTFHYFAFSDDMLKKVHVDTLRAFIRYQDGVDPSYSGSYLVNDSTLVEPFSFVIQTLDAKLDTKTSFSSFDSIQFKTEPPIAANGNFTNFSLTWRNKKYVGHANASEIVYNQSFVIEMAEYGNYLLTSYRENEALCEHYFHLHQLLEFELEERAQVGYMCDP